MAPEVGPAGCRGLRFSGAEWMDETEYREPGSQISAITTDTSVAEVESMGQFLAAMTAGRPDLAALTVAQRELYWRNAIVGALFDRGFVRDLRIGADGSGLGNIAGAIVVKRDGGKAIVVACEVAYDSLSLGPKLMSEGRAWAAENGMRFGIMREQAPIFIDL